MILLRVVSRNVLSFNVRADSGVGSGARTPKSSGYEPEALPFS